MLKQPLLSVIVPVYNAERYLRRCVDSLLKQTYPNLEIILVDDGSADDSPRICDMYEQAEPNIRVIHKENGGAGYARNSGLDVAEGAYVAFCDADDFVDENMYSLLMAKAEAENADAVFCDFAILKSNGIVESADSTIPAGHYSGRTLLRNMLGAIPESKYEFAFDVSACKAVYSRHLIENNGLRFPSEREVVSEDLFFHIAFLPKAEKVSYIKNRLYYYCENNSSHSHSYVEGRLEREKRLHRSVYRAAGELMQDEDVLRWQRLFLGRIRSTMGQYVYYAKDLTFAEKIRQLRQIADDEQVRFVIESYPIHRNPLKLRIFNSFLKWRFCVGMYILLVLNR